MKETTIYGRLVMAVKNTAQVVIGGKIITLGGYESEEYFQKVASYINNKIAELSEMPGYTRQPVETKHTLLSLNVTDDYFKAKKTDAPSRKHLFYIFYQRIKSDIFPHTKSSHTAHTHHAAHGSCHHHFVCCCIGLNFCTHI